MKKIDRHYVSDFDKEMAKFNQKTPRSPSQQFEYDKYKKIYQLRDEPGLMRPGAQEIAWD